MKKNMKIAVCLFMTGVSAIVLSGCGGHSKSNGKIQINMMQYKPEATDFFEEFEAKFNAEHDDIELTIDSPNDAMTILKTRLIR